ncbi:MAG TPA: NAD(P)H-binding protein [Acidimicrobiales bacterium]|nr:NAD(P)H-binding protein [Acidimicrobiales bacterium]
MKLFLAGATGAIGRYAVPALVAAGHEVTGVARSDAKAAWLRGRGASPVSVSIFDRAQLAEAVAGHEAVVNMATRIPPTSEARKAASWVENSRIRREGSAALVDAALAAGIGRYVQESITFTYPDRGDAWIDEEVPTDVPESLSTTADAEASARRFTEAGAVGVVLRFGALYGPGSEQTDMMLGLARRHVGTALGSPGGYISQLHLADAGGAVVAALGVPAGTYNVVDDEPVTKRAQARLVGEAVGVRPWIVVPGRLGRFVGGPADTLSRSQRVSNAKLRATGWAPRYPTVREGLAATIAAQAGADAGAAGRGTAATEQPGTAGPGTAGTDHPGAAGAAGRGAGSTTAAAGEHARG